MLGASALELFKNRHELAGGAGVGPLAIAIGMLVSFVVALLVVRWFIGIVTKHGFVTVRGVPDRRRCSAAFVWLDGAVRSGPVP